ncbi:hypothetical protein OESDEN_23969 [Oesophagostomum dentatum]|uniref:Uncharacterized protein n=1 Tax=Oesophagostomum dentatum TaxID=61180 RepID=A0A0B1RXP9_OESDE|nr:hypothetical protein OESDEN_23969 [Oesophagostomum dentatum]
MMQFAQYILPLRNNKTFSFGFLMVEKNLPWFRKLLEHTLPIGDETTPKDGPSLYSKLKSINPRQTVGTVLALCGWKLYFSIYHPMHTAGGKKNRSISSIFWVSMTMTILARILTVITLQQKM